MNLQTAILIAVIVAVVVAVGGPVERVRSGRPWSDGIIQELGVGAVLFVTIVVWNLLLLDWAAWAAFLIGISVLYWVARLFRVFSDG